MDGIADMGGTEGGRRAYPPVSDEPVFAEPWQGRAFALTLLSTRISGRNIDAFRGCLATCTDIPELSTSSSRLPCCRARDHRDDHDHPD